MKSTINERALQKYNSYLENTKNNIPKQELAYPCNDKSKGVRNFSEWSYFKHQDEKHKIINRTASHMWNKKLLDRLNKRQVELRSSDIPVKTKTVPGVVKTTKAQRMRENYLHTLRASESSSEAGASRGGGTSSYVWSTPAASVVSDI
mmetsp:Transcript_23019/g.33680  ORF Transcript_23019/g.33680 Transcript_23019/m.33680 type:complete len:148 (-) Transcript_23019:177-620(-)